MHHIITVFIFFILVLYIERCTLRMDFFTTLAFCLMHIVLMHRCPGLSGQQAASRANLRAAGAKTESAEPFDQSSRRAAASVSSGGGEMVY